MEEELDYFERALVKTLKARPATRELAARAKKHITEAPLPIIEQAGHAMSPTVAGSTPGRTMDPHGLLHLNSIHPGSFLPVVHAPHDCRRQVKRCHNHHDSSRPTTPPRG
jgi:hypothetical protein